LFILLISNSNSISTILLVYYIIPFGFEVYYFLKKFLKFYNYSFKIKNYVEFVSFCLKAFIIGALFVSCDRFFLVHIKAVDSSLSANLSFAFGFVGIISVFNASFTNYFLGKLNPENIEDISLFKNNIKKRARLFFSFTIIGIIFICLFVYYVYNQLDDLIIPILVLVILKTSIVSFFGFTNVISKFLHLQNIELIINLLRLIFVWLVIQYYNDFGFIYSLSIISIIMILGEYILNKIIDSRISKLTK